jgi:hypothetical protein
MNWENPNITTSFGLSVYSKETVEFKELICTKGQSQKLMKILYDGIFDRSQKIEFNKKPVSDEGTLKDVYTSFENTNIGYGYYAFVNKS